MLDSGVEVIKTAFTRATGNGRYIVLYLIAIIFTVIYMKGKNNKSLLINYSIISVLIIFNPIVAFILGKFINLGSNVYWRLFWNIPLGITIAYMFTEIVFMLSSKTKKIIMALSLILIIVYSGKIIYTKDVFQKVNNYFKIPDEELEVINIVLNDANINSLKKCKVLFPREINAHVRQISSDIELIYDRNPGGGEYNYVTSAKCLNENKLEEAIGNLKQNHANYLVWENSLVIQNKDVQLLRSTQNYNIYKLVY